VWLIRAVVCLLAANTGSNKWFALAGNGWPHNAKSTTISLTIHYQIAVWGRNDRKQLGIGVNPKEKMRKLFTFSGPHTTSFRFDDLFHELCSLWLDRGYKS